MCRDELDHVYRVGKPRESREDGVGSSSSRAMIVKLRGHSTKMKFMKSRKSLKGTKIFHTEDLTNINYDLLLRAKDHCSEGVAVCSVDGTVMARCSNSNRVFRIKNKDDLFKYFLLNSAPGDAVNDE